MNDEFFSICLLPVLAFFQSKRIKIFIVEIFSNLDLIDYHQFKGKIPPTQPSFAFCSPRPPPHTPQTPFFPARSSCDSYFFECTFFSSHGCEVFPWWRRFHKCLPHVIKSRFIFKSLTWKELSIWFFSSWRCWYGAGVRRARGSTRLDGAGCVVPTAAARTPEQMRFLRTLCHCWPARSAPLPQKKVT